jgi:filamentous hemagglutinin family protein
MRPYHLFFFLLCLCPAPSFADPALINIDEGIASVSQIGSQTLIQQSSDKAILNWNNFDLGEGSSAVFQQPNANSLTVNRIANTSFETYINGSVTANGRLVFINPAGIIFGEQSVVNATALIASTNNLLNDDVFDSDSQITFTDFDPVQGFIQANGAMNISRGGSLILNGHNVTVRGNLSGDDTNIAVNTANSMVVDLSNGTGLVSLFLIDGSITLDNAQINAKHNNINLIAGEDINIQNSRIDAGEGNIIIEAADEIAVRHSTIQSTGGDIQIQTAPQQGRIEIIDSVIASQGGGDLGVVSIEVDDLNNDIKQAFISDNRVIYATERGGDISIKSALVNGNGSCIVSGNDPECLNFPVFQVDARRIESEQRARNAVAKTQTKSSNRMKEIPPITAQNSVADVNDLVRFGGDELTNSSDNEE